MAIGFQEFNVQQFRAEIAKMSDAELISIGRSLPQHLSPASRIAKQEHV
jgi:hypothetical protein